MIVLKSYRIRSHSIPTVVCHRFCRYSFTTKSNFEPLRILFCGSDEFSAASLHKLHDEHQRNKNFIASIDVVCRPGKPVGRGQKTIREGFWSAKSSCTSVLNMGTVPIAKVADELGLPSHKIDTFTGWHVSIYFRLETVCITKCTTATKVSKPARQSDSRSLIWTLRTSKDS